ncbi:SRPBCC family protein [Mycolicibacterium thermoresistibile]
MAEISRSRTIAADAQQIWAVLAEFGALSSWADKVDHSCILTTGPHGGLIGTTRRVQIGRTTLVERVIEVDPPRALSYRICGLPLRGVVNRWALAPVDGATVVTLTSTVDSGAGMLRRVGAALSARMLAQQSAALLDDLADRCLAEEVRHV